MELIFLLAAGGAG